MPLVRVATKSTQHTVRQSAIRAVMSKKVNIHKVRHNATSVCSWRERTEYDDMPHMLRSAHWLEQTLISSSSFITITSSHHHFLFLSSHFPSSTTFIFFYEQEDARQFPDLSEH